jgi:DNA-binding transcriptional MerR regulator
VADVIQAFSQKRASRLTGLSVRQLEYWDQTDVLQPSIAAHEVRGLPRLYSFADLLRLSVAKRLRDHRLLPREIRKLAIDLRGMGLDEPLLTVQFLAPSTGSGHSARQVFWVHPVTHEVRSARATGQLVETFDLDLVEIRSGLQGRIQELSKRVPGEVTSVRGVRSSAPVLKGTRVPTAKIRLLAQGGWDPERILEEFPQLERIDIDAALRFEAKRLSA